VNSYQTDPLTNQYETIRSGCLPVSFQIAKKSAPEVGKEEQCIPRPPADDIQNQINLFVSQSSLEEKSLSLHPFVETDKGEKEKGRKRNEPAHNITSYSQSLIQTCGIEANASQVSLTIQAEKKEITNVTSCHLPISQDLSISHLHVSTSQDLLASSLPSNPNLTTSHLPSRQDQSVATNMLSQEENKTEPVTPPDNPPGKNTSPPNLAIYTDKKYSKPKKRKIYESTAPVYDNRQIFAADLLQTQLDYAVDEGGEDCEGLAGDSMVDLALVSGTEDYGPFKKVWSETYLCYNLGKEIICLLCFCRFTQFKKYNLNRHMQKKHNQYYELSAQTKRRCLVELARRYEEYVTSSILSGVPAQGNHKMAQDILQLRNIDWVDLLGEDFTMFDFAQQQPCSDNLT